MRAMVRWVAWWAVLAGLWLLLVDKTKAPELWAGAAAAAISATAAELVRRQRVAELGFEPGWLRGAPRALARVPADTLIVGAVLWRRLVRRAPVGGAVRAIRFRSGGDERRSTGCRLLATGLDSLGPNSYVIGIDPERELMLVHQLAPRDDPASADPMELRAVLPERRSAPERGERR